MLLNTKATPPPSPKTLNSLEPSNLPGPSNARKLTTDSEPLECKSPPILPGPSNALKLATDSDPSESNTLSNLPGPSNATKLADPKPPLSNSPLNLTGSSNSNNLSASRYDFNYLSKSANDLTSEFEGPSTSRRSLNHVISNFAIPRSSTFINSKLSKFLSTSIDSSNPSTSTKSSNPSSPSINLSIDRSYTYAGSSGITKPNLTGNRHGFYRISRRYSDSDESVVRTVIEDVNLGMGSESSFNSVKAAASNENLEIDQALFIRELSRSITMGPIIPGTQGVQPTFTRVQDVSSEEI